MPTTRLPARRKRGRNIVDWGCPTLSVRKNNDDISHLASGAQDMNVAKVSRVDTRGRVGAARANKAPLRNQCS